MLNLRARFIMWALGRTLSIRDPDFLIGPEDDVYLRRWFAIPKNPFLNIYVHKVERDDDDRALHDHPWWFFSFIISGGYLEVLKDEAIIRNPGTWYFRGPWKGHRLQLLARDTPTWTVVVTGPVIRAWGFHCPQGWVPWKKFVTVREGGNSVGVGCG